MISGSKIKVLEGRTICRKYEFIRFGTVKHGNHSAMADETMCAVASSNVCGGEDEVKDESMMMGEGGEDEVKEDKEDSVMYTLVNMVDDSKFKVSGKALKVCQMLAVQIESGDAEEGVMIITHHTDLLPHLVEFINYYAYHPINVNDKGEYDIGLRGPKFEGNIDYNNKTRDHAQWYDTFINKFGPEFGEKPELKDEGDKRWFEVHGELRERSQKVFDMYELARYVQCHPLCELMHCKMGELTWKGNIEGLYGWVAAMLPIELLSKEGVELRAENVEKAHKIREMSECSFIDALEHVYKLGIPVQKGGLLEGVPDSP